MVRDRLEARLTSLQGGYQYLGTVTYCLETCMHSRPESHSCRHKMPEGLVSVQHKSIRSNYAHRHLRSGTLLWRFVGIMGLDLVVKNIDIPEQLVRHIGPESC